MRFVPIKSDDQLDLQSLHRVRERWGDASHCGDQPDSWFAAGTWDHSTKGAAYVEEAPGILEDADTKLSGAVRFLLAQLKLELVQIGSAPGGGRYTNPDDGFGA